MGELVDATVPPDPDGLVLALATLPLAQREAFARACMATAADELVNGRRHLSRVYLELGTVAAHATELVDDVTVLADRLMAAALTPPVMISPN
jgi:hypothetical protein